MIISASRRTDLPAFFPEETIRKIMDIHYNKEPVDAVVFWTKNAEPIIPYLDILMEVRIPFYFQYTLNYYPQLEPNIPKFSDRVKTFQKLSKIYGKERVIWRFDPIVLVEGKDKISEIMQVMTDIASQIYPYTEKCVFSYFDKYPKCPIELRSPNKFEQAHCRDMFRYVKDRYGLIIATCAEDNQGEDFVKNKCIDPELLERLGVNVKDKSKDPSQRTKCGCIKSFDIGQYHTCKHGCRYCYAK